MRARPYTFWPHASVVAAPTKLMLIVLLAAVATAQSTQSTAPSTQPFNNPVGWQWLLVPIEISPNMPAPNWDGQAGDAKYSFRQVADGVVVLDLATTDRCGRTGQGNEYRVVVVADGYRHTAGPRAVMSSAEGIRYHFRPAHQMPADRPAWVGIELLTPDGRRKQSEDALRRAAAAGTEILALPEIGKPLHFRLTTLDGNVVSDADLRGKVVLIDGWATWCSPCMEKMSKLRELCRERQPDGFSVIGINFDQTPEKARQAIAEHELKWSHVYVPADERTRELWYEASSLSNLPRLILLDRAGVVRADIDPDQLPDELKKVMAPEKP